MKHLQTMLAAVLSLMALPSFAVDSSFRCHGRAYEQGFFFRYSVELHDKSASRSKLTVRSGYGDSTDYDWRQIPTPNNGKFAVDSPFNEYKAFLSQEGRIFSLILVDPVTSVPEEHPPYDRFVCVTDL
ncbi:hypothetical protein B9G69_007100 [Bdellovibrio sp. SKB1291214]|uniref:hypothetical protein n=1 Tax=Bdellovibrio sp. SKB1291214 TaxID=1732569 RepID=UPI000B74D053|nr:hypothetical protein [Bdellovibrio sp. SKB1291214]UYL10346.1 hypothetical protein B9G69_007100 [Bdellovibrio sp. SKB1291214]